MKTELGVNWESNFKAFSHNAIAAASLGQVHKAILVDGRMVACKLQYPAMNGVVENDLRQLKAILSIYNVFGTTIRQDEVYQELAERLYEELDYIREEKHLKLYNSIFKDIDFIDIPKPITALTTHRLLTMDWLNGISIKEFLDKKPSQEERNELAIKLFYAWYKPFYQYGVIHGDPHMGNFSLDSKNRLNLFDFGAVRIFSPEFIDGVVQLFYALRENNTEKAFNAYKSWGFKDISYETSEVLNNWARFFFKPLMINDVYSMEDNNSPEQAKEVLKGVYEGLKHTGGITLPREFVLLDRSAIGLGSIFLHLKATINWHQLFMDIIKDFSKEKVTQNQHEILKFAEIES